MINGSIIATRYLLIALSLEQYVRDSPRTACRWLFCMYVLLSGVEPGTPRPAWRRLLRSATGNELRCCCCAALPVPPYATLIALIASWLAVGLGSTGNISIYRQICQTVGQHLLHITLHTCIPQITSTFMANKRGTKLHTGEIDQ